ncbi:MAG: hypothetical protein DRG83_05435, partial [Deltaproteobacteria bacterium]
MPQTNLMPSILDREISVKADDAFGHQDFANALRSLIESEQNQPPYSIGLLGPWGTGKSTIKSLYLSDLEDDTTIDSHGKKRSQRIKALTFNAWRYGGSNDIKRALLRHVFLELGGSDQTLKDELYNQIKSSFLRPRTCKDIWFEVYEKGVWNLVPVAVFMAILLGAVWTTKSLLGIQNPTTVGLVSLAFSIAGTLSTKYLGSMATFSIPRYSRATRIEMPRTSAEEYEELLMKQITVFEQKHKDYERLVIFVDDLDRLSSNEMADGLDAIRVFMELPQDSLGIIFVISCDEQRIAEALKGRHRNSDLPGAVVTRADARKYLDRIFQFRLEIPPLPKQDMRNFALHHLREAAPDIIKEIESNGGNIGNVVDRMIHIDVSSPRNAIQIVNTFIQSWWLAKNREFSGSGTQRAGGLLEGTITKHPVTLAVLCALKVDYPHFYNKLQEEPDLIQHFTEVFVQQSRQFKDLPPKPKHLLSVYCNDGKLLPEHASLRRYISSLRGLRWPDSIQPFIQLSQDPVTRKYGSRATRIIAALISGDTVGVLQELGRDKDSRPISEEDAQLLGNIIEDLEDEAESRRNNAAAVVASISERIPTVSQSRLLHPLCRQLELSRDFRSRIGVATIARILDKVHPDYQRRIVGLLIDDAYGDEQNFSLLLETMQPPSLDEAKQMAETIASMALKVWNRHGLSSDVQKKLCDWLLGRTISLGQESATLPYDFLEQCMERYQDILLPEIGSKYTDLFIGELENERTSNLDLARAIQRSRVVFDNLQAAGEDDRPVLWKQLARMVSVRTPEAVTFAWNYANLQKDKADAACVSAFVASLSGRLLKDIQEKDDWGIEQWEEGGKVLLQIASTRENDLEDKAIEGLTNLALEYSVIEDTVSFCITIINILERRSRDKVKEIIFNMTSNLLSELPDQGILWLAKHFHDLLNEAERQQVQQKINELLSKSEVDDVAARKYACFFGSLTTSGYNTKEVQGHIQQAFQTLQNRQNEFEPFVKKLFPTMVTMLRNKVPNNIGGNLRQLFNHYQSQPAWLAWLHKTIAEYWPKKLPGLNMTTVFDNGIAIASNNPSQQDMDGALRSLAKMITVGAVPADGNVARVVKLACDLWPYHREASLAVLKSFDEAPEPAGIVKLMEGIDSSDGAFSDLQAAWQHIVPLLARDRLQQATSLILSQSMIGPKDEPDRALAIWLDSMNAEKCAETLHACLEDSKTPDEHKDRLWIQAINLGEKIEKEFYLDAIPKIFSTDNIPKTQNTVIESADETNALFRTASEKNLLAKSLLNAFLNSSSIEMKRRIATWLHNIGGEAQLKDLNT